jgi:cytochrome b561
LHEQAARPAQDRLAPAAHYGLYLLVFSMAGTGLATSILAGLNRSVFQGSGEPLPESFAIYPTFVAHAYLAWLLLGLLVVHVIGALYHQFFLTDGLFRRMWFGRRVSRLSVLAE